MLAKNYKHLAWLASVNKDCYRMVLVKVTTDLNSGHKPGDLHLIYFRMQSK